MVTAHVSLAGRAAPPAIAGRQKAAPITLPALIVFGRDDAGKAHASCFGEEDAELARKAADLMDYYVLPGNAEGVASIISTLPAGRVFASGKAFVPFVKGSTYETLANAAGVPVQALQSKPKSTSTPKQANAGDKAGSNAAEAPSRHTAPTDWSQIQAGSLVLASEGALEGWFEAIVVEAKPEDMFVVRWRDWPDEPVLVRRREHLGLLHPQFAAE